MSHKKKNKRKSEKKNCTIKQRGEREGEKSEREGR